MSMDRTIVTWREIVCDRLQASEGFTATESEPKVPVITHKTGDISAAITRALRQMRVCAVLIIESARETGHQTVRPEYRVRFSVLAVENLTFNKSGKDAWTLAFQAASALKLLSIDDEDLRGLVELADEDISEITPAEQRGMLIVRVPFEAILAGVPRAAA